MNTKNRLIIFLVILLILIIQPQVRSPNDASRMATIQSLVESHSFIIDNSIFVNTDDKVFINGHFYSDKIIMPSIIGSIIYFPLFLLGIKLNLGSNLAYYLITLFTVKLFWLVGLIAFYSALEKTNINDKSRLSLSIALAVGSLYFTWSTVFNNHILAGSFLIIGYYFLLKTKQPHSDLKYLFLTGFFLSLAGAVDIPSYIFYVIFLIYLLLDLDKKTNIIPYILSGILIILPIIYIQYTITGSIIPVQLNKTFYDYPGSPWILDQLPGLGVNQGLFLFTYSFTALFGSKGFLLYNPFLFLAIVYLFFEIKSKRSFWKEALVISISSLIILLYYLVFTNNYGGWSYSIRWFVPFIPLLFFFIYPFFEDFTDNKRILFTFLFILSSTIAVIGIINPWSNETLSSIPLIANIKEFIILIH